MYSPYGTQLIPDLNIPGCGSHEASVSRYEGRTSWWRLFFMPFGGDYVKKKKYKPTRFKAKDSVYNEQLADFAVNFIECLCHTKGT